MGFSACSAMIARRMIVILSSSLRVSPRQTYSSADMDLVSSISLSLPSAPLSSVSALRALTSGFFFLSGQFLAICPCLLQVKHRPSLRHFSASSSIVVTAWLLLPRFLQLERDRSALVSMALGSGRGSLTLRRAASWLAIIPPFLPPPLFCPPKSSEILRRFWTAILSLWNCRATSAQSWNVWG